MSTGPPAGLGRGVVVVPGSDPPTAWASCPRVVVGDGALVDPGPTVETLHRHWAERQPVVVELTADPKVLRAPERCEEPVYELGPGFEFPRERLQFLVWANNYDSRGGDPIWWHGRKAARSFAGDGVREEGPGDVHLADGTMLFVDGGPPHPPPLATGIGVVHRWNAEAGSLRAAGHAEPSSELAPDQLAAVGHLRGPARVIAPAGSGKTRVLTERLHHLLANRGVHPNTVTALAYNNKAAAELRERCEDIEGLPALNIRTLNSFGLWICSQFGPTARPRVIEETDVRDLLQRLIQIRRQSNTDTVAPYISALSSIRLGLASPAAVEAAIPDAGGIAEAFDRYRGALADAGAVDFDEQIYQAIEILLSDPGARALVQAKCRHLLVDEFQDLNAAHLLLIRLVSSPGFDCFGVGDDDQVIYGYSGATPEFLINYPRYFPGAASHPLKVNYRCPPAIVGAARHLLSYNARRVKKEIITPEGRTDTVGGLGEPLFGSGPVTVLRAPAEEQAALAVATITAWREAGTDLYDIAVLARVNSALLPVQVACIEAEVPCTTPLSATVLNRTGLRTAFAYLRIGTDPGRIPSADVNETIRRPSRGIAPKVVDMLTARSTTSVTDIRRLAGRLTGRDVPKLETYAHDLEVVARACERTTVAALRAIRIGIALGDNMDILDASRQEPDRSTHADDLIALESVAALHPDVATFEAWLREVLAHPPADGPTVLLSTVHRIKGREWGRVIIYGASAGLFPHRLGNDEEGERRVFHVALTRARTQVVALADKESPSFFLAELDGSRVRPSTRSGVKVTAAGPGGSRQAGSAGRAESRSPRAGRRSAQRRGGVPARVGLPTVHAVIGLVVEDRGNTGTVVEVDENGVVLLVGAARIGVAFGADVRVGGESVTLAGPAVGPAEVTARSKAAEEALRTWRSGVASREALPAYVIMKDTELAGLASRDPRTLAQLAACPGMGEIRLERWGDEILAILDASREQA